MNKSLRPILAAFGLTTATIFALVGFGTAGVGCASINSSINATLSDPAKVAAICASVQAAVATATADVIKSKPTYAVYFGAASDALVLAVNSGNFSPGPLNTLVLNSIPAQYQADISGGLNLGLAAYSLFYATNLSTWQSGTGNTADLAQVLKAIQAGIQQGLGNTSVATASGAPVKPITAFTAADYTLSTTKP